MAIGNNGLHFRHSGLSVEIAETADAVRDAQMLRHRVFSLERNIFDVGPQCNVDCDDFDSRAKHVLIRRVADSEAIATSRVVASDARVTGGDLPMHRYCCPTLFCNLPVATLGEISRFAISKQARAQQTSGPLLRLGLLQGILAASQSMGLTHWCALMEPSLMRLLGATGVQFTPVGPMVDAYGLRQPCVARIDVIVTGGRQSHPHFYETVVDRTYALAA